MATCVQHPLPPPPQCQKKKYLKIRNEEQAPTVVKIGQIQKKYGNPPKYGNFRVPAEQDNVDLQVFPHHRWNVKRPPARKCHQQSKKKE